MNSPYPAGTMYITAQNSSRLVKGRDQETKKIIVKEKRKNKGRSRVKKNKKCFELPLIA